MYYLLLKVVILYLVKKIVADVKLKRKVVFRDGRIIADEKLDILKYFRENGV